MATSRALSRRQVSITKTFPAPVGGLNAKDSLADMPATDAIVMDNWFPNPTSVSLRNGYSLFSTGYPGWVESIFTYENATTTKIFGASGTAFYDATAGGAIGASVVSGLTNARWESVNMATAGGQYLYCANGVDAPQLYSGAAWQAVTGVSAPIAITGVTTTKLRNPTVWKNRLWFIEEGSTNAWYLPTASVGGLAAVFPFGALLRLGGKLQAILTANLTDGSTFDNYIGFMSDQGEILLYRGTDPAFAGTFSLVGIYNIGKPVGRRCILNYGDDAIIICSDGFVSLAKLVSIGRKSTQEGISDKIIDLVGTDVLNYNSHFGWQGVLSPIGNKIIINVPASENSSQYQYVMNTITNSWCRFTGWNAACFAVQGNNVYFGGSNYIALCDTGTADNTAAITGTLKTAFNYLGTDGQKFVKMVRPLFQTNGTLLAATSVNMDFTDRPPMAQTSTQTTGTSWDSSAWDVSSWSTGLFMQSQWMTVMGVGFTCAAYFVVSTPTITVNLQAIDYCFERGGVL